MLPTRFGSSKFFHGGLSFEPRRGSVVTDPPRLTVAGFGISLTKKSARGTIVAPCRASFEYGEAIPALVSVISMSTRFTFVDAVAPTHCRTVPANGFAIPASPVRSANTTDDGTGKEIVGYQSFKVPSLPCTEIHAQCSLLLLARLPLAPPPLGVLALLARALCGITIPINPPSRRYRSTHRA